MGSYSFPERNNLSNDESPDQARPTVEITMSDDTKGKDAHTKELETLTREIKNGNPLALDQILKLYGSALIAYSSARTGNEDIAEEVVQDVFMQLWNDRSKLESDYNLVNYLYWLTRNKSIDAVRSDSKARQREQNWMNQIFTEQGHSSENFALKSIDAMEIRTRVYDLLSAAPPKCREIFMLVWDTQLSYEEVAGKLGISVRTVRNQVSRAIKVLSDRWGEN